MGGYIRPLHLKLFKCHEDITSNDYVLNDNTIMKDWINSNLTFLECLTLVNTILSSSKTEFPSAFALGLWRFLSRPPLVFCFLFSPPAHYP